MGADAQLLDDREPGGIDAWTISQPHVVESRACPGNGALKSRN
jgi:hypothetical protein